MKVVVGTNVFISGAFFVGKPQRALEKIVDGEIYGLCSAGILDEYREIVQGMMERKKGTERFLNLYSGETQILPQVVGKLFFVPCGRRLIIDKCKKGVFIFRPQNR